MERQKKRKQLLNEDVENKKIKTDLYIKYKEMESLLIVKIIENKELLLKIKALNNKITRIENFNYELRNKNTKLEQDINSKLENVINNLEEKENELCDSLNNINLYSYIN